MSISTAIPAHQQSLETYEQYQEILNKLADGRVLSDIPWEDPRFQKLTIAALARSGINARAAGEFDAFKRNLRDVIGLRP